MYAYETIFGGIINVVDVLKNFPHWNAKFGVNQCENRAKYGCLTVINDVFGRVKLK